MVFPGIHGVYKATGPHHWAPSCWAVRAIALLQAPGLARLFQGLDGLRKILTGKDMGKP